MGLNLLQLNGGMKAFGGQRLFEDAAFAINEGEHVGVIGPNGAGKTTLFKILVGEEELDGGQLIRSQSLRLAYLSQHDHWLEGETGNAYLQRVSRLPLWQVKSMARDLKIAEDVFTKPISSLSGGYRMRIKLTGLLGSDPNLMLLDEPTNYLDLETTLVLENFLQNYQGAFLLISHDREFLRRTTDHTLEVEAGEITKFNGHIDDYFEQKELLQAQLAARAQNQAEKRKAILDFVNRFGAKATKAKQAQSKLKRLEKMETIEMKAVPIRAAIRIPEPAAVGRTVIHLQDAEFGYGDKRVLRRVNIEVRRGDHLAVVGLNGSGKSTLLKGLAGTLAPMRGTRELGHQVEVAIFNQFVAESLNPAHSVFQSLLEGCAPSVTEQDVRNMAGSLLFSSDHIQKKISVLSGGEKSRVALGRILLRRAPCLLLDEPTNHLDFQTVEALTEALRQFSGTLIAVSHDRGFIRRVASKILEISNGEARLYPGTYDEYVWSLQRNLLSAETEAAAETEGQVRPAATATPNAPPASGSLKRENDKKIRALDRKIAACEARMKELEAENIKLNDQIAAGHPERAKWIEELARNATEVERLESEWISAHEQKEHLR